MSKSKIKMITIGSASVIVGLVSSLVIYGYGCRQGYIVACNNLSERFKKAQTSYNHYEED